MEPRPLLVDDHRVDVVAKADMLDHGIGWDLNRPWPTGHPPTRTASRNIWAAIERVDADVVVDLHSSGGIYGEAGSGVGQAGFPTPSAKGKMKRVLSRLNDRFFSGSRWPDSHRFTIGNEQNGATPLLIHKVGGDLAPAKGFLFETYRRPPIAEQTQWNLWATLFALEECGVPVESRLLFMVAVDVIAPAVLECVVL